MFREDDFPHVDVFICCYSEPPDIIEPTAIAAVNMNYPGKHIAHAAEAISCAMFGCCAHGSADERTSIAASSCCKCTVIPCKLTRVVQGSHCRSCYRGYNAAMGAADDPELCSHFNSSVISQWPAQTGVLQGFSSTQWHSNNSACNHLPSDQKHMRIQSTCSENSSMAHSDVICLQVPNCMYMCSMTARTQRSLP